MHAAAPFIDLLAVAVLWRNNGREKEERTTGVERGSGRRCRVLEEAVWCAMKDLKQLTTWYTFLLFLTFLIA